QTFGDWHYSLPVLMLLFPSGSRRYVAPTGARGKGGEVSLHLRVNVVTGMLEGVRQVLSPHRDARPAGTQADLIVIHGISLPPGEFGGAWIEQLFTGHLPRGVHPYLDSIQGMRVSAHLLV